MQAHAAGLQGRPAAAARRPRRRPRRVGLPGRHADPGADARLHPEDRRASPSCSSSAARGCSTRSSPTPSSSTARSRSWSAAVNAEQLLELVRRAARARLRPRARAHRAAVPARAAVLAPACPRARPRVVAVALAVGLSPVASQALGDAASPRDAWELGGAGGQGAARRLRVRVRDRRAVRRAVRRRLAPRHADRLLVRRARRPGHRQPVLGALAALLDGRRADLHRHRRRRAG